MTGLLQRVRAFDRQHPLWWDLAVAIAVTVIALIANLPRDPVGAAFVAVVAIGVMLRRRKPVPALLTVLSAVVFSAVVSSLTGVGGAWLYLTMWVMLFNVGLRVGSRRMWAFGVIILVAGLAAFVDPVNGFSSDLLERIRSSVGVTAMSAASYLVGVQINIRRQALVTHRREAAREAVIAERSRIAHEMHDIIGHNLSVITSLANGGSVAVRNSPPDAEHAFDAIGEISRSSVQEVRRILTVLRYDQSPDGASLTPQPGLDDVAALVDTVRATGVNIALERSGDLERISPGRQLVVFRIVQESLTNVLRHGGPRPHVSISIASVVAELTVIVENTGTRSRSTPSDSSTEPGHGIVGMRERAAAYGGTVDAHATPVGWRVSARIPDDRIGNR
ncbi:sensor histidine kinase [Microbacterium sp. MPKO10]|uniref:sensor histidine kinase n=1 Tax=Microbacterium sp. MPKO10 TaxID=2989818 RepID=UPI0022358BC1|nr:histidine kinase [Microbacterium sp. MPKO10]MCW4457893.1 histidine kinase [Microbacterium sp. MPKO10]